MPNNEVLIKVEGLSKKFSKNLKSSLWYGVKDIFAAITGNTKERFLRKNEFWALQDINFELRRGECLGLIGHNGAGKSTLLKILNGLINPDAGKVTIKGRVGALIELGAGFNPILTGRENIYNNGAILGFSKKEIDAKVDEIIDFAEIREFIDMPVQNYSSGMRVRLGFAVAAQMEPDVLLIDEVLAVGDVSFRAKCYERMSELMKKTALILVSHSMPQIGRITSKILLLKRGFSFYEGSVSEGIETYYDIFEDRLKAIRNNSQIQNIQFFGIKENYLNGEKLEFDLSFDSKVFNNNIEFNFIILSREEFPVVQCNTKIFKEYCKIKKGVNKFSFSTEGLRLNTGVYFLSFTIFDSYYKKNIIWLDKIVRIKFNSKFIGVSSYLPYISVKSIR